MARSFANTKDGICRLNTKVVDGGDEFFVELYQTLVYHEMSDRVILRTGGWATPTTASRINQALHHRGIKGGVVVRGRKMYFSTFDEQGEQFLDPFIDNAYTIEKEVA